jgi:histidinol dehydrogenase
MPGVTCWRELRPIEKVGLYIPGGTAVLPSTFLMLGIPARIAGCNEIVVCSPPQKNGKVNAFIAYVALMLGIEKIYLVGGSQAIAAMAYGTESITKVDKIFGPGNQFVTKAKTIIQSNHHNCY